MNTHQQNIFRKIVRTDGAKTSMSKRRSLSVVILLMLIGLVSWLFHYLTHTLHLEKLLAIFIALIPIFAIMFFQKHFRGEWVRQMIVPNDYEIRRAIILIHQGFSPYLHVNVSQKELWCVRFRIIDAETFKESIPWTRICFTSESRAKKYAQRAMKNGLAIYHRSKKPSSVSVHEMDNATKANNLEEFVLNTDYYLAVTGY